MPFRRKIRPSVLATVGAGLFLSLGLSHANPPIVRSALDTGSLGLYSASDFRLTTGQCVNCTTIPQALWYFKHDVIAVPQQAPVDFTPNLRAQTDVQQWLLRNRAAPEGKKPPLLWLGSPQITSGVLSDQGKTLVSNGQRLPFAVTPKIESNLSYFDQSSVQHFLQRPLTARGQVEGNRFVARTIWPQDYAFAFEQLPYQPLASGESVESLVRSDSDKAHAPLATRVLWQRDPKAPRQWGNKPVLAFMLNGAQGDDDEAHGGHFAVATGTMGNRGEWDHWLINNFYNLDSVSEKGIIASTLPMDAYMADLNSGQSWYRPSYMLVMVMKNERVPALYQEAIGRVFNHFYRHDFHYVHTSANCAGLSVETLRSLGWQIPRQGPTSRPKALAALPYKAIQDMSISSGRKAFDYLMAERTNLYPFVAFNAIGDDVLQRITHKAAPRSDVERMLADDVEAVLYVRIPQFPSSRAMGQAPVASIDEYMDRVPANQADWKIVPVGPRPFPDELRDPNAPSEPHLPSFWALWGYGGVVTAIAWLLWRRRQRKQQR